MKDPLYILYKIRNKYEIQISHILHKHKLTNAAKIRNFIALVISP